jgi:hypothetical protein
VHAGLDWDWEIPAVTLVALAAGASLVVLARPDGAARPWTPRLRAVTIAGTVVVGAVALTAHVGNRAAADSEDALTRADAPGAVRSARRARAWQPWAASPERLLGEAELALGHDAVAAKALRKAIRRDPESWRAWYDLAVVAKARERAVAIRRATALNPLSPELQELRDEPAHTDS